MIELVTTLADEAAAKDTNERAKALRLQYDNAVRQAILSCLIVLDDSLGKFEQTTHASLFRHGPTIKMVADALVECWESPKAVNISELSQVIQGFIKAHTSK